ncbi:MAG: site-2 protease family protein [Patescibacteria group bacterium]|jgi:Zn-dependent protease
MLIDSLRDSPSTFAAIFLSIVYALTIHEYAHAWAASAMGDQTAKNNGRLSLNPLVHMELFGTLMLLVAGFGWGKPVPVNPYNLKYRRWGEALVSLAGPISNFLSVISFVLIFRLVSPHFEPTNMLNIFLLYLIMVNVILGVFNLIPIPPLDGSKVLFAILPDKWESVKHKLAVNGPWILLAIILLDNFGKTHILASLFGVVANFIESLL